MARDEVLQQLGLTEDQAAGFFQSHLSKGRYLDLRTGHWMGVRPNNPEYLRPGGGDIPLDRLAELAHEYVDSLTA